MSEVAELNQNRFLCRWWFSKKNPAKQIVIVYDLTIQRVVYKAVSNHRKDQYNHICRFYGQEAVDTLKHVDSKLYDGMF